jgi:thymidine phosphorylase
MSANPAEPNAEPFPKGQPYLLGVKHLGIQSLQEAQIFMRKDCHVCRSEGFSSHARVLVSHNGRSIVANLYQVTSDIVAIDEVGMSDAAWDGLRLEDGAKVTISHPPPVESLSAVRGKVYGKRLDFPSLAHIVSDIEAGRYSNIQLSAFITACAARALDHNEICALTQAMVEAGNHIAWNKKPIVDKHCVGGLPGNRTTPVIVAIVAACGLTIPKTSSRAITSPAGTADTMETMAPIDLDMAAMRRVVEREGGCIVWGGAARLSPTDDILIRVENVLDLDSEGQLVASILSKKIAAGATHLVLDLPVGPTAKVRTKESAEVLSQSLNEVGAEFGLVVRTILTDGTQPVGRGIGPALEARNILDVLQEKPGAPEDLRLRALLLAGHILELGGAAGPGEGMALAKATLESGRAWIKFQRICEAQGGMRVPRVAPHHRVVTAPRAGLVTHLDNRRLSKVAKLAGAPEDNAAGLELHVRLGDTVEARQPLYTVHSESPGELAYALNYARANPDIIAVLDP